MISIEPKSSIIAIAVKRILIDIGTLFPNNERTANANAISVPIGIPKPLTVEVPKLIATKISAGQSIPPIAPKIGSMAFFIG